MLTWSLVVPTFNRRDVLLRVLPLAFGQTVPPVQVVIVDASPDWQVTRQAVQALAADHPAIQLDYLQAVTPSSATQRNQGVEQAIGDIVVMIDDDSFLYPDYVERILAVYAADTQGVLAGVNGVNVPAMPDADAGASAGLARKDDRRGGTGGLRERVMRYRLGRWISSRILFQDMHALFLKYEGERNPAVPPEFAHLDVTPMTFMSGHGLSVHRRIALAEPLDRSLRYYAALEDLDASYRYGRHGLLLRANGANLHHFEVAGGRVKRRTATTFQLLNMLVFIKRNADRPGSWLSRYRWMLWRRLLGETIKDALSRRWDFPQARGVVTAMRSWRAVWRTPAADLNQWYPAYQRALLDRG
ncbi:glycosyltransferase family A protein [Paracoccus shandongensis]|uniref:glycosyltransferase family A protein n=1 Tax=Paracoccus shandongensis TaxID=2816048 RepID=UPI001A902546|nr:glycosyltransferase family 2 protein [Paracoccus shandongensis]